MDAEAAKKAALRARGERAADAEQARKDEPAITDQRDRVQHLREELADSVEKKLEAGDKEGAARAADREEALAKALSIIEKMAGNVQRMPDQRLIEKFTPKTKCGGCHQGTAICGGDHVAMMVAPRDRALWKFFQGVIINGVKYTGYCLVAKSQADNIAAMIGRFEASERKRLLNAGSVFGDAGVLGGSVAAVPNGGIGFNPMLAAKQ